MRNVKKKASFETPNPHAPERPNGSVQASMTKKASFETPNPMHLKDQMAAFKPP